MIEPDDDILNAEFVIDPHEIIAHFWECCDLAADLHDCERQLRSLDHALAIAPLRERLL